MFLKIKKLKANTQLPRRAYDSVGYDCFPLETISLNPGDRKLIDLGFSSEFEPGYVALLMDKSGIGNKGVTKFAGVIDPDYRGSWGVILFNSSKECFKCPPEKAIIQILFVKVELPEIQEVLEIGSTNRGVRGFGSSDGEMKC